MSRWIAAALAALVLGLGTASWANEAAPLADDPVVERRLIAISAELRCLVCQNESLAGSRADLALDHHALARAHHAGLDGEHMFPQSVGLHKFTNDLPSFVSCHKAPLMLL